MVSYYWIFAVSDVRVSCAKKMNFNKQLRLLSVMRYIVFTLFFFLIFLFPIQAQATNSDNEGVYVFKDAKKDGTITIVKQWRDRKDNSNRPIPDMEISTTKPEGEMKKYLVTFHGNGLNFTDGTTENTIVYLSDGHIIDGQYKVPNGTNVCWYTDTTYKTRFYISNDGSINDGITQNLDLYAKEATFEIKNGDAFNALIPENAMVVSFTDEIKPAGVDIIDVDADGDSGVTAWMESDVLKVSTQINGVKVIANSNCKNMFYKKSNLTAIDFGNIDTSYVTNMQAMFSGCKQLQKLDVSMFDTSNVRNMNSMFYSCENLTDLDVSMFRTDKVTNLGHMFVDCKTLKELDLSHFNTENVTNIEYLFQRCSNLISVNITNWNTSKVTTMQCMFSECGNLKNIDLSHFDTSNVITMRRLFHRCLSLTSIDLSNIDTSKVTNMEAMFYMCSNLTNLNIQHFETKNVTNMSMMFLLCSKLKTLDVTGFHTEKVTDMSHMFSSCQSLTELDLSSFDTSHVKNMLQMFYDCNRLLTLNISSFDTSNVTNMNKMWYNCKNITLLDLSSFNTTKVTSMEYTFYACHGMTTLVLGDTFHFVGDTYSIPLSSWKNSGGEIFESDGTICNIPSNIADVYTKCA